MRFRLILVFALVTILASWHPATANDSDWMHEYTVDTNTIGLWHFNECSEETAYDASPNHNDGVIYGADSVQGKFGCALRFDGHADDYGDSLHIYLHDVNFMAGSHTWEAWIKPLSIGTQQTIMSMDGGHDQIPMYIRPDGRISFRVVHNDPDYHEEVCSIRPLTAGDYYHVACVWDNHSREVAIYINGCKDNSRILSYSPSIPENNLLEIGKVSTGPPPRPRSFFDGEIDEVRISSVARTYECQQDIPTLTEWGLIIFGVVLVGFITWVFLRRRKAVVNLR